VSKLKNPDGTFRYIFNNICLNSAKVITKYYTEKCEGTYSQFGKYEDATCDDLIDMEGLANS